jgi:organic radical activating enzyme
MSLPVADAEEVFEKWRGEGGAVGRLILWLRGVPVEYD